MKKEDDDNNTGTVSLPGDYDDSNDNAEYNDDEDDGADIDGGQI